MMPEWATLEEIVRIRVIGLCAVDGLVVCTLSIPPPLVLTHAHFELLSWHKLLTGVLRRCRGATSHI